MAFTALTPQQEQRLRQLEQVVERRRAVVLDNAAARARVLLADAIVAQPPRRRVQAELQARLLHAKADALEQTLDHAATVRWHDAMIRRALFELGLAR
ncbi:MAG: hypothetical protein QM750_07095 [Rubrivivax sp.]